MELLETSLRVKGHRNDGGSGASPLWAKAEGAGTVLPGEKKALSEEHRSAQKPEGVLQSREGQALLSVAQRQEQRQWPQTEAQVAPPEHWESLFHHEGDGALAQDAQRGLESLSLEVGVQKLSEGGPGQWSAGAPVWAWGLDQMTCRGVLQPILWSRRCADMPPLRYFFTMKKVEITFTPLASASVCLALKISSKSCFWIYKIINV